MLAHTQEEEEGDGGSDGEEVGGLFRVVREKEAARAEQHQLADGADCSLFRQPARRWGYL
jgi:hypothetical protein